MKKLTLLFLLLSALGKGQTYLQWRAIQPAPANLYIPVSATSGTNTGVWTPTLLTSVLPSTVGLLPNTTSLTINGTTKTFTSTPSFTVGDLFSTSSYTNPSWLSSLAWSKITGTPTTISGYGITDPLIKGTLSTNYIPKAAGTNSLVNSIIQDNGSTATVNGNFYTSTSGGAEIYVNGTSSYMSADQQTNTNIETNLLQNHFLHNVKNSFNAPLNEVLGDFYSTSPDGFSTMRVIDGDLRLRYNNGTIASVFDVTDGGVSASFSNGVSGGDIAIQDNYNTFSHSIQNTFDSPLNNFPQETASKIAWFDASKNLKGVALGSGLSLTSGTLTATGTGSTTTITAGSNITVTGPAPAYTVAVSSGLTNSVSSNNTAISTLSTNLTSLTSSVSANNTAISTLSTNVATNTSSITTLSTQERFLFQGNSLSTSPADATTYYMGEYPLALVTTAGSVKFQFANNRTITKALITIRNTTNGSNEAVSFYLRENGTTDYTITTSLDMSLIGALGSKTYVYTPTIPVTSGTDYEIKIVTPTWVTQNPASVFFTVKLFGY